MNVDNIDFEMKGSENFKGMTLQEVGDELGLSRERVRQIEERALKKLRMALLKRGIMDIKDVL